MLLNKDIAQKLVNNIMENLGYNINIMNDDGIIIASGSPERVGTYHQIAEEVIQKKKRIDIYEGTIDEYIGVKEGINMPFYFHNKIAGVIGITGNPNEIENTAMLVKMTAEIMMEQEFLKERTQSHQSDKTFFVNRLLSLSNPDEALEVSQWSTKLGFDLNLKRIACLFTVKNIMSSTQPKSSLSLEQMKKYVLEAIKASPYHSKQDISTYIDVNKILVLKTVQKTDSKSVKEQLSNYLEPIQELVKKKHQLGVIVGIGSFHEEIFSLRNSYDEALAMIVLADKLNIKEGFFFINDYVLEYFFYKLPKDYHDHFLEKYKCELLDKPEISETIRALIRNNMNIADTAKELYVHRNTVLFRINKIKELFDIDPLHLDRDRLILRLIDFYIKYYM